MSVNTRDHLPEAHLRFFVGQNKCTLTFKLQLPENDKFREVCETIVVTRHITERVQDLLLHSENKLQKFMEDYVKKDENNGNEVDLNDLELNISLKNKSKSIHDGTELKFIQSFKRMTFHVFDSMFKVMVNVPHVENVKLPLVIYSGHSVQPAIAKALLADQEMSKYSWYTSADKANWQLVGSEYHYKVTEDDLGSYLKFVYLPINNYSIGLPFEVDSVSTVCRVPEVPYCPFQDRQRETPTMLTGNKFRVVTYNTLSCLYTNDQFEYCPIEYLAVDYRKQLLLKEMFGYNADVLCCQEVDNKIYSFYFRSEFGKINYGSIFNKKGNRIPEGLAIFYNKNRFKFSGQGHIVFNTEINTSPMTDILKAMKEDQETFDAFMKQPSSMQHLLLRSKNNQHLIIVANTHLYYHPDADSVRLLQTAVCLEYLSGICEKEKRQNKGKSFTVIFCGDLNSKPESDVYKFITEGSIQFKSNAHEATLSHSFQFSSACGTPEFTNYVSDFKACLDYIFYMNATCKRYVSFPSEDVLAKNTALPSRVFPSDHLALIADMQLK